MAEKKKTQGVQEPKTETPKEIKEVKTETPAQNFEELFKAEEIKYNKLSTRYNKAKEEIKDLKEDIKEQEEDIKELEYQIAELKNKIHGNEVIMNSMTRNENILNEAMNAKNSDFNSAMETVWNVLANIQSSLELAKPLFENVQNKYHHRDQVTRNNITRKGE